MIVAHSPVKSAVLFPLSDYKCWTSPSSQKGSRQKGSQLIINTMDMSATVLSWLTIIISYNMLTQAAVCAVHHSCYLTVYINWKLDIHNHPWAISHTLVTTGKHHSDQYSTVTHITGSEHLPMEAKCDERGVDYTWCVYTCFFTSQMAFTHQGNLQTDNCKCHHKQARIYECVQMVVVRKEPQLMKEVLFITFCVRQPKKCSALKNSTQNSTNITPSVSSTTTTTTIYYFLCLAGPQQWMNCH